MDIVYLLIPVSLVLVFLIGAVFWWAVRRGQFDDLEGPAHRILMDDDHTGGGAAKGGNRR
jgi:cbb3-type cytochrome oxidase maturation protein